MLSRTRNDPGLRILRNCSLVCKAWVSRASLYLFREFSCVREQEIFHALTVIRQSKRVQQSIVCLTIALRGIPLIEYCHAIISCSRLQQLNILQAHPVYSLHKREVWPRNTEKTLEHFHMSSMLKDTSLVTFIQIIALFGTVKHATIIQPSHDQRGDAARISSVVGLTVSDYQSTALPVVADWFMPCSLSNLCLDVQKGESPAIQAPLVDEALRMMGGSIIHLSYKHSRFYEPLLESEHIQVAG